MGKFLFPVISLSFLRDWLLLWGDFAICLATRNRSRVTRYLALWGNENKFASLAGEFALLAWPGLVSLEIAFETFAAALVACNELSCWRSGLGLKLISYMRSNWCLLDNSSLNLLCLLELLRMRGS